MNNKIDNMWKSFTVLLVTGGTELYNDKTCTTLKEAKEGIINILLSGGVSTPRDHGLFHIIEKSGPSDVKIAISREKGSGLLRKKNTKAKMQSKIRSTVKISKMLEDQRRQDALIKARHLEDNGGNGDPTDEIAVGDEDGKSPRLEEEEESDEEDEGKSAVDNRKKDVPQLNYDRSKGQKSRNSDPLFALNSREGAPDIIHIIRSNASTIYQAVKEAEALLSSSNKNERLLDAVLELRSTQPFSSAGVTSITDVMQRCGERDAQWNDIVFLSLQADAVGGVLRPQAELLFDFARIVGDASLDRYACSLPFSFMILFISPENKLCENCISH